MLFATNRRKAQEKNFKRLRASCSGGLPVAPQRAKADDRRSSSLEWGRAVTFLPPVTAAATTLPVKAHRFGSTSGENGPPLTARGDCQVAHPYPTDALPRVPISNRQDADAAIIWSAPSRRPPLSGLARKWRAKTR